MDKYLEFEKTVIEFKEKIIELKRFADESGVDLSGEIAKLEEKLEAKKDEVYSNMSRWQRVELARIPSRPTFLDYVEHIFEDFVEFHGDRNFGDDGAIVCGIGLLEGKPVTIIGQQKGRNTQENIRRNFGMPHPEGYRKALRHMKLAEKFGRPVICFIDTPGAYPGISAEERGQGQAIAQNLLEMSSLTVPTISIVIGEGGSGGALALGVSNIVMMLENAIYSVISPEGFASIIYKDQSRVKEAADALKLTASDLLSLKVIDQIIEEPQGGAHRDMEKTAQNIKKQISCQLKTLKDMDAEKLQEHRYNKFRNIGVYKAITS